MLTSSSRLLLWRPLLAVGRLSVLILLGSGIAVATEPTEETSRPSWSGDFRLRLEQDWDSQRADGTERADRLRARVRARLGMQWEATPRLTFGLRLRSGAEASHQSPHVTVLDFDNNDTGSADFSFDRWYLEARGDHTWGWAGRNGFPFWKQNEFFWDDDVTPVGLAGGWTSGGLSVRAAEFGLPVGMKDFAGSLSALQVVWEQPAAGCAWTVAAGYYHFGADPEDPDAVRLRHGNGLRDYSVGLLSAQARLRAADRPLKLGLDLLHNSENYGPGDSFAFARRGATDGWIGSVQWGQARQAGEWALGYWYASIEALAVNASYAQDDWVRWGSATETDSSDLRGHELRFVYGLGSAGSLTARLYLVEAISSIQDGKRFRVDYNFRF